MIDCLILLYMYLHVRMYIGACSSFLYVDRLLSVFRHFSLLLLFLYTYVAVLVNGKLKLKLSIILYNNNITYVYMYVHLTTVLHYNHACTSHTFVYIRTFSRLKN